MLHEFITERREEIVNRSVGKAGTPPSAADVLDHGRFLDQLSDSLRTGLITPSLTRVHFQHRLPLPGLPPIWQDYFDIRDAINELVFETKAHITLDEASHLDRYVDDAFVHAI